ncbi:MAG TPA: SIMPL domain-containing protein [Ilumatobacteraceae bacterium]|nr:SIMPL domain-containing protein [Ilumatobacteraceae bacterium]
MATATVRGSASRSVQPDYVAVTLGITEVAKDAATAMGKVADRSQRLEELLGQLKIAKQDWVTEGVNVAEEWEYKRDTNTMVGYRATSGVVVTVRQLDRVGRLLRDAVDQCSANARELRWQVDRDNPAKRELLGEAAADALDRATAYATALGMQVGAVELISDDPIVESSSDSGLYGGGQMRAMMAKADSAPVSVSGGLIELVAEVHVRFGLLSTNR